MSKVNIILSPQAARWVADNHDCLELIAQFLAEAKANRKQVSSSSLRYFVREVLGRKTPSACFAEIVAYVIAHRPRLAGVYGTRKRI
jgi:hypothetical protein